MNNINLQTALITPLTPDGRLDEEVLDRLIRRILAAQTIDFSILGSTGEGAGASLTLRRQMREAVLKRIQGQREVYTGVMGTVQDDIYRDIDALRDLNLTGLLIPSPSYYLMDSQYVEKFYQDVADFASVPIIERAVKPLG